MQDRKASSKFSLAKEFFNRYLYLKSCGIAIAFVSAIYIFVGIPGFETHDDVLMAITAAGAGFVDQPNPHIIYSHIFVGYLLCSLYSLLPSIPWYGVYIVGSQTIAMSIIVFLLQKKGRSKSVYLLVFLGLIACLRPLMLVQFTTTAALVASAGSLLLLYAQEHLKLKSLRWNYSIGALILFTYASLIRAESAYLIIALSCVVVLFQQLLRLDKAKLKNTLAFLILSTVTIFIFQNINLSIYEADKEWRGLYAHNKATWNLLNSKRLQASDSQTRMVLEKAGWSSADLDMFQYWYFKDPKFSDQNLKKLEAQLPKLNPFENLDFFKSRAIATLTDKSVISTIAVMVIFIFWLTSTRLPPLTALMLCTSIAIISAILIITTKCPPRVYASMLIYTALVFLLYSSPKAAKEIFKSKTSILGVSILAGTLLYVSLGWYYNQIKYIVHNREVVRDFCLKLNNPDALVVIWGGELPVQDLSVFENFNKRFGKIKMVGINSMLDSPIFRNRLNQFGIKNLLTQLDSKSIRLIAEDAIRDCIEDYMIKTHKTRPVFEEIEELSAENSLNLKVYRTRFSEQFLRPDNDSSPDCPKVIKEDLILFPDSIKPKLQNTKAMKRSNGDSIFTIVGEQPILSFALRSNPIKTDEFSHIFVEIAVDKIIKNNRKLCLWVAINNRRGYLRFIRLQEDSGKHLYVFDLKKLNLKPGDTISHINVNPLFKRTNYTGEQFILGRIGLIRKDTPISCLF